MCMHVFVLPFLSVQEICKSSCAEFAHLPSVSAKQPGFSKYPGQYCMVYVFEHRYGSVLYIRELVPLVGSLQITLQCGHRNYIWRSMCKDLWNSWVLENDTAHHTGHHMGGAPRKQIHPSRWGAKGERGAVHTCLYWGSGWSTQAKNVSRGHPCVFISGHRQMTARRGSCKRNQTYHTGIPSHLGRPFMACLWGH